MTLIHVLNGELYQHVPEALLAVMELVPAHKDLNTIEVFVSWNKFHNRKKCFRNMLIQFPIQDMNQSHSCHKFLLHYHSIQFVRNMNIHWCSMKSRMCKIR